MGPALLTSITVPQSESAVKKIAPFIPQRQKRHLPMHEPAPILREREREREREEGLFSNGQEKLMSYLLTSFLDGRDPKLSTPTRATNSAALIESHDLNPRPLRGGV